MVRVGICYTDGVLWGELVDIIQSTSEKLNLDIKLRKYMTAEALFSNISTKHLLDILFLDVCGDESKGVSIAREVRKRHENLYIVYLSKWNLCCKELVNFNNITFVDKPYEEEQILPIFWRLYRVCIKIPYYYYYQIGSVTGRVNLKKVMWFESRGRQITIHMSDETEIQYTGKLNDVETRMAEGSPCVFIRIHQSHYINFDYVEFKTYKNVTMVGGKEFSISAERRVYVRDLFDELMNLNVGKKMSNKPKKSIDSRESETNK